MLLHLHKPSPPLDRFVELVTFFSGYDPGHRKERLIPDGGIEIVVDLTETPKRLFNREDHSRWTSFRGAWISGMRRGWIVIEAAPQSSMAVIRFRPGGAYPFLGFGVEAITDTVDGLDAVLAEMAGSLRNRILEAPTVAAKMQAIESWLLERAAGRLDGSPVVDYVTNRLFAPAGLRIADVVDEVGYSQRHLLGLFRRWVGLPPKQYARIRRFQQVLGSIATPNGSAVDPPPEPDWADVAAGHGYYDQSHLIRDFQEFAGMSPGSYVDSYRGLENYLPFD